MFHVPCDVIGIAQYHFFEIQDGVMYFAFYQDLKLFLVNFYRKTLETKLKRF